MLRVFVSKVAYFSFWVTYTFTLTFIICACTFGILKTFQVHRRMYSIRRNRALQSRRLTKTLMFISLLALLSWIPIIVMNTLEAINVSDRKRDECYFIICLIAFHKQRVHSAVDIFGLCIHWHQFSPPPPHPPSPKIILYALFRESSFTLCFACWCANLLRSNFEDREVIFNSSFELYVICLRR